MASSDPLGRTLRSEIEDDAREPSPDFLPKQAVGVAAAAQESAGPAQGIAGGIIFPLSTNNPITGTLTLNQQQAADLLSGLYYVNIHSATFTQGEIRGQIVQSACKTVYLPFSAK